MLLNSLPLILVPSLVVLFVAHTCEHPFAVLALVGFLASVSSKVNHQVSLLGERTPAVIVRALEELQA